MESHTVLYFVQQLYTIQGRSFEYRKWLNYSGWAENQGNLLDITRHQTHKHKLDYTTTTTTRVHLSLGQWSDFPTITLACCFCSAQLILVSQSTSMVVLRICACRFLFAKSIHFHSEKAACVVRMRTSSLTLLLRLLCKYIEIIL